MQASLAVSRENGLFSAAQESKDEQATGGTWKNNA
jgi:hypothetical protein